MERIDAHQHFWLYNEERDTWITEDMSAIRRNFLPDHLEPVLRDNGISGCVAVQADQSEPENDFLLSLAAENPIIRGIVGWVDLRSPQVQERLEHYQQFPLMKGFRHVLQGEPQRDLMLRPDFMEGIGRLASYGFTYDLLIFPDQLRYADQLVKAFPGQRFVLDHVAKPHIRTGDMDQWKKDVAALAANDNVWCKISGMITEADWKNWTLEDLRPVLDTVTEAFGVQRLLYGSDWPVCLVAGDYQQVAGVIDDYYSTFTETEKEQIWGGNAIEFYNL